MLAGSLHSTLLSERRVSACMCAGMCARLRACVCVLRMTEGFWQNEVTLFYQVNLCVGGQDKEFVCVPLSVCKCVH